MLFKTVAVIFALSQGSVMGAPWRSQDKMAQADRDAKMRGEAERSNAAAAALAYSRGLAQSQDQNYLKQNTAGASQAPQPGDTSYQNTGDLGFMRLPVERTTGGFQNNIWSNPQPTDIFNPDTKNIDSFPFNPLLQGYFSGGKNGTWNPYLPDKITLKSPGTNLGPTPGGGNATQWINGKEYNINGNNYAAGTNAPAPYQFATAPGDARMSEAAPFTGFQFGEQGKPGSRFMAGSFDGGKFYASQPDSLNPKPDRNLGTFQPWNPAAAALQQYRSQP